MTSITSIWAIGAIGPIVTSKKGCYPPGSKSAGTRLTRSAAPLPSTGEANNPTRNLYDNNRAVYSLLRYGVKVKTGAGENTENVCLIDWDHPEANEFALAQEVTLQGEHERRPDLVLYVNGLAIGVVELKRSTVSIGEGINRLNLSNQASEFNAWFFSTVQILFAGNDSEGLQYGTIGTSEKYFLTWKEDEADNAGLQAGQVPAKMCRKDRLIELMRDFVLFDAA